MIAHTNELIWLWGILTFDPLCLKGLWRLAHILLFSLWLKGDTHSTTLQPCAPP